ncbi:N-acetylmuramoyl-L-alanine amidase, partial [Gordonibacter massiliensis (ex Traore et al. 2017)]|uniref:N-acetylmuramoyl-L-alanine amidase n=1 Tax=Gordonibacter massiliensis (ex Traore et al. 2017) TaxID=1841863 RepID=UPI001C8CBCEC|nr:N-acetylmuramoyl-L-alanine amidase [Gordonibacter massiliensis (ex Traore et al. 2017)]
MTLTRKMASVFMSVLLLFSLNPAMPAIADETTDNINSQAGSIDADEAIAASAGDPFDIPDEGETVTGDLTEDIATAIEYIYMDSKVVSAGDTQLLAVALADASSKVSSMSVKIVGESGFDRDLSPLACVDNAASFEMPIGEDLQTGAYRISEITYRLKNSDAEHIVSVSNTEEGQYSFTVLPNGSLGNLASKEVDKAVGETTAFVIDENGSLAETNTLEDAISVAQTSSASTFSFRTRTTNIVVAIDPGHGTDPNTGAYDPGASANGIVEAEVNESIARYCKEELEQYFGVTVLLVPRYKSVNARVDWAVANSAQVYVSLHNNSAAASAHGFEIYVPNESSFNWAAHVTGTELGRKIEAQLASLGLYDRGVKYKDSKYENGSGPYYYDDGHLADYYSAIERSRQYGIAGIIVEHAFLTNANNADFLKNESNLRALGVGDATAIAQQYGLSKVSEEAYRAIYDYDYYIAHNPDVFQAYGNDRSAVFKHFLDFGMDEPRQGSAAFDAISYYNEYPDLRRAFGTSS